MRQPVQHRVKGARADLVTVFAEFLDHPATIEGRFRCVVQNMAADQPRCCKAMTEMATQIPHDPGAGAHRGETLKLSLAAGMCWALAMLGVYAQPQLLEPGRPTRRSAMMGIDHRPRKGGHGRHAVDGLPWAHTVFGNLKTWLRGTFHAFCAARSTQSPSPITD
jgi:hypothetical protein